MIFKSENKEPVIEQFFEYVKKRFNFLTINYGYQKAVTKYDDDIGFAYVYFIGKKNAVEVIMDTRDKQVDCKISKLVNGKLTELYAVDNKGEVVREDIYDLLRKQGVHSRLLTKSDATRFSERFKIDVDDYVSMIKNYSALILSRFSDT